MKQHIDMACGTYATIHALANSQLVDIGTRALSPRPKPPRSFSRVFLAGTGSFRSFYEKAKDAQSAEERSRLLEMDKGMEEAHEQCASAGETSPDVDVKHHFVCFL